MSETMSKLHVSCLGPSWVRQLREREREDGKQLGLWHSNHNPLSCITYSFFCLCNLRSLTPEHVLWSGLIDLMLSCTWPTSTRTVTPVVPSFTHHTGGLLRWDLSYWSRWSLSHPRLNRGRFSDAKWERRLNTSPIWRLQRSRTTFAVFMIFSLSLKTSLEW